MEGGKGRRGRKSGNKARKPSFKKYWAHHIRANRKRLGSTSGLARTGAHGSLLKSTVAAAEVYQRAVRDLSGQGGWQYAVLYNTSLNLQRKFQKLRDGLWPQLPWNSYDPFGGGHK